LYRYPLLLLLLPVLLVVAIKRANGHMQSNPSGDHTLQAGDTLIAVGGTGQLDQLKKMAGAAGSGQLPRGV
jgi:uncharacterized protein with PhoU and TrkA domain